MKFKSYYWAIFAAAGVVVILLASMAVSRFMAGNGDSSQSPHSEDEIQKMLSEIDREPQISAYRDLLAANPDDYVAMAGLGELYFSLNRYEEAAAEFERALALNPADSTYYGYLGAAYLELGRTADSEAILLKGLAMAPDDQSLLLETGYLYYLMGRSDAARSMWQKAYDENPSSTLATEAKKLLDELDSAQTQTGTATSPHN